MKLPSPDPPLKFGNASWLYPLVWRFLPVLDPQVSLYFSRDLDSQLGERELAAVTEFVNFTEASVSLLVLTSISNCRVTNIQRVI